jgi:hypothetical protein
MDNEQIKLAFKLGYAQGLKKAQDLSEDDKELAEKKKRKSNVLRNLAILAGLGLVGGGGYVLHKDLKGIANATREAGKSTAGAVSGASRAIPAAISDSTKNLVDAQLIAGSMSPNGRTVSAPYWSSRFENLVSLVNGE